MNYTPFAPEYTAKTCKDLSDVENAIAGCLSAIEHGRKTGKYPKGFGLSKLQLRLNSLIKLRSKYA